MQVLVTGQRKPWKIIYLIGVSAKYELRLALNGIPKNMPTFSEVIAKDKYNVVESKQYFVDTIQEYLLTFQAGTLPDSHVLFGEITQEDWGFMEFLHLDHHLKQFKI